MPPPIELPRGLVLRAADVDDIDQIVAQNVAAFGPQDGPDVRAYLDGEPGLEAWSVVADGDRIVSSMGGLPLRLQLDGLALPGYQIEYVVTERDHQRRGLVRHQVEWHHRRADALGAVMTMIGGIPYFYRRFGYGYGVDHPELFVFDPGSVPAPSGVTVRDGTGDDLDDLVDLERKRPREGLRACRDRGHWRDLLAMITGSPWHHLLVAEVDGAIHGWAHLFDHPDDLRMTLLPSVATSAVAARALVHASLERAGDHLLVAFDSPGDPFGACLHEVGSGFPLDHGFYVRVADERRFLQHIRHLLSERLAASAFARETDEVDISLYVRGVRLRIVDGEVAAVEEIPPVEDPLTEVSVGVPPDWFPALVLGRWGARELARRVDDVMLGHHAEIMDVLFPVRPADIAGDF